jgi:nucleoside-diphosphate-sugar epimerase
VSHDDAAAAAAAALTLPSGRYNVVDDEPVTHQEFAESLAAAAGAEPPRLPPAWIAPLFGSLGEMFARSLRISNRKIKSATDWTPAYRSVHQGWAAALAGISRELTIPSRPLDHRS